MNIPGYIKLHRSLLDWRWWDDIPTFRVFVYLLLTARFDEGDWMEEKLSPGQLIIGRKELAAKTGLSEQQVRTALNHLKSTGEITIKSTNRYSVVTVANWGLYQSDYSMATSQSTNDQPATNQQLTSNQHIRDFQPMTPSRSRDFQPANQPANQLTQPLNSQQTRTLRSNDPTSQSTNDQPAINQQSTNSQPQLKNDKNVKKERIKEDTNTADTIPPIQDPGPFGLTAEEIQASQERDEAIEATAKSNGLPTHEAAITKANELVETYGLEALLNAIKIAGLGAAQTWSYVEGILKKKSAKCPPTTQTTTRKEGENPYAEYLGANQ